MVQLPVLSAAEACDDPVQWPIVGHEVRGVGAVSSFVNDVVEMPDGGRMDRQYLLHPGAVCVVAVDEEERVVVIRQYRHPVGFQLVEIPAGLLDSEDDASYLAAAQRELAEEAMLAADDWRVLIDTFTTPGAAQETLRFYLARGLRAVGRPEGFVVEDEEAHMDICLVGVDDLLDAIYAGKVQSPSLVPGVLAYDAARRSGRLESLRSADAPWPARLVRRRHNAALTAFTG